jgi:hypothetical protein
LLACSLHAAKTNHPTTSSPPSLQVPSRVRHASGTLSSQCDLILMPGCPPPLQFFATKPKLPPQM